MACIPDTLLFEYFREVADWDRVSRARRIELSSTVRGPTTRDRRVSNYLRTSRGARVRTARQVLRSLLSLLGMMVYAVGSLSSRARERGASAVPRRSRKCAVRERGVVKKTRKNAFTRILLRNINSSIGFPPPFDDYFERPVFTDCLSIDVM